MNRETAPPGLEMELGNFFRRRASVRTPSNYRPGPAPPAATMSPEPWRGSLQFAAYS